ncbi:g11365 [Coccomyxa elongata]
MPEKVVPGEVLKDLKDVVQEINYDFTEKDVAAVSACRIGETFMQLFYGGVGAAGVWGVTSAKPIERYRAFRLAAAVGTGLWAGERSREPSGIACLKLLVALPTPLGGEVASLIRERDPDSPLLRNTPKRMDGDPNSRIATDEARWAIEQHASSAARHVVSAARERPSTAGSDFDSDSAESAPVWEFEPMWEGEQREAAASQQPHSRRDRRRERRRLAQHPEGDERQNDEALKDYFDSRWDEPQAPR